MYSLTGYFRQNKNLKGKSSSGLQLKMLEESILFPLPGPDHLLKFNSKIQGKRVLDLSCK